MNAFCQSFKQTRAFHFRLVSTAVMFFAGTTSLYAQSGDFICRYSGGDEGNNYRGHPANLHLDLTKKIAIWSISGSFNNDGSVNRGPQRITVTNNTIKWSYTFDPSPELKRANFINGVASLEFDRISGRLEETQTFPPHGGRILQFQCAKAEKLL